LRNRPRGEYGHKDLQGRRLIAERSIYLVGVVDASLPSRHPTIHPAAQLIVNLPEAGRRDGFTIIRPLDVARKRASDDIGEVVVFFPFQRRQLTKPARCALPESLRSILT
jgi:hypothetical protein